MELSKENPFVWFDVRDPYFSVDQKRTNEGTMYFHVQALRQLDQLKTKFIRKKLDQIIFDFLLEQALLPFEAKKVLNESEELKARFYQQYRRLFKKLRHHLSQMRDIIQNSDKLLLDIDFGEKINQKINRRLFSKARADL